MRRQGRAFASSLIMHLVACMLVFGVVRGTVPERKMVIIDFSLGDRPGTLHSGQPLGGPECKSRASEARRPTPAKTAEQRVSPVRNITRARASHASQAAFREDQGAVAVRETPLSPGQGSVMGAPTSLANQEMAGPGTGAPGPGSGHGSTLTSASGPGGGTEQGEKGYVKAHFAAIRAAIIRKLSYPRVARRMGWEGTVKVCFTVNEDGWADNVRVLGSSGFTALDNDAVETIRRCSPYPKPPVTAQVIMPITYRLDQ